MTGTKLTRGNDSPFHLPYIKWFNILRPVIAPTVRSAVAQYIAPSGVTAEAIVTILRVVVRQR